MIDEDTKAKIYDHYIKGQGSIQDIARVYRVTVPDVLAIIGRTDLASVEYDGDLIDADEAGPGATLNQGRRESIPFTLD